MALPKLFNLITWHNNTTPAINEDNLNAMSQAIDDIDDRVIGLAGTIMEDVPQIQEDLEILEPAIENIDSNVERAETAADDAEDSAETAEYWANVSNPPIPVVKDFASVISVDDAIPKAATDVKVKIEAVQDLHGYTKPWVGGAGKNKLPNEITTATEAGVTFATQANGKIKISGTSTRDIFNTDICENFSLPEGTYIFSYDAVNGVNVQICNRAETSQWLFINSSNPSKTLTVTSAMVNDMRVRFIINPNTAVNGTTGVMIRPSTISDSTFAPYTNICPISGFTEAKVTRTGKNLLDSSSGVLRQYTSDPTVLRWGYNPILLNAGTYTISYTKNTNYDLYLVYTDTWESLDLSASGTTFTLSSKREVFIRSALSSGSTEATFLSHFSNVQLEIGNHATTYEPYNGTDYIIDLDGTRYGATLDVDSGQLVVDRALVEFDGSNDEVWDMSSGTNVNAWHQFYLTKGDAKDSLNMQTNKFQLINIGDRGQKTGAISYNDKTMRFALVDKEVLITSVTDWKAWLASSPLEVVYELATPITVQLTPTEVQMLQGYNVLSANSGDVYLKYDASMIQRIANEKLDISTFKSVVASSSDFADFKTKVAAL